MSEHEISSSSRPSGEAASPHERDITPRDAETQAASAHPPHCAASKPTRILAVVPVRPDPEWPDAEPKVPSGTFVRYCLAVAATVALAGAVAATIALVREHRQQDDLLAERAHETQSLAQSVKALNVRFEAIESSKSREDLAELRRSVGEVKSSIASARDLNGVLAQLSQRLEKLDQEESAKVDKLGEPVDHETNARTAELSVLIEKLEKRLVAPIVASAPTPAPPSLSQTKQPAPPLKSGSTVSMETIGSIQRPRPVLQGYIVLDAQDDVALIGGRFGEREVRLGDFLPGAGRVERIERQGRSWVVLTNEGLIAAAVPPLD